MGMDVFSMAFHRMKIYAEQEREVIIAFSGGRESQCVLDMAYKARFQRIVCFSMYFVEGLEIFDAPIREAKERYPEVEMIQVPHWNQFQDIKAGHYCLPSSKALEMPDVKFSTVCSAMMAKYNIPLLMTGERLSDTLARQIFLNQPGHAKAVSPIAAWKRSEVLAYLKCNKINVSFGGEAFDKATGSGLDLSPGTLLWLYDSHPEAFAKIRETFQFIDAAVMRRKWYGFGAFDPKKASNSRGETAIDKRMQLEHEIYVSNRMEVEKKYGKAEAAKYGK